MVSLSNQAAKNTYYFAYCVKLTHSQGRLFGSSKKRDNRGEIEVDKGSNKFYLTVMFADSKCMDTLLSIKATTHSKWEYKKAAAR